VSGRIVVVAILSLVAVAAAAAPARAETRSVYHGGTYVGSVVVEPGQLVQGNLTVIAGDATIAGFVDGDVDVIGGNLYERPGATITGQVNTVGGDVVGTVVPWSAPVEPAEPAGESRSFGPIAADVLAILFFLIFPMRARVALDRLEHHPGLCAAIGLLGWVAVLPIAVLLLCTIILIPFIPVEVVLVIAAVLLGKATLALLVGRRLCEVIRPAATPAPFLALLVGLALITAAELIPLIGGVVTVFVALMGMGSTLLAFVKESTIAPGLSAPPPPLSGPPMPVA
jgi:hypothetical protein